MQCISLCSILLCRYVYIGRYTYFSLAMFITAIGILCESTDLRINMFIKSGIYWIFIYIGIAYFLNIY